MKFALALRAAWYGFVQPARVAQVGQPSALTPFAISVLLIALVAAAGALIEDSVPALQQETAHLVPQATAAPDAVDLSLFQRKFTAALGGSLMTSIVGLLVSAAILRVFMLFLTDAAVAFSAGVIAMASTMLIQILGIVVSTALHIVFGSIQSGPHLGMLVSPITQPMIFAWLQRIDVFSLWQYVAAACSLAVAGGLHSRYGLVVGPIVWLVTRIGIGGLTFVAWVVQNL